MWGVLDSIFGDTNPCQDLGNFPQSVEIYWGHQQSSIRWPTAYLIVVCGHPRQQDEGPPVVAKVAHYQRPHGRLAQQQLPGNCAH